MKGANIYDKIGIASLFDGTEIKDYFNSLLLLVGGIEFFILIAHFLSSIGPDKGPFPWKQYFLISFLAPIVLLFILGLIVLGFNYYVFGGRESISSQEENSYVGTKMKRFGHSFRFMLSSFHQIPVLAGLFVLGLGSVAIYKSDVILKAVGQAGEKTAFYLLIGVGVMVAIALIFLLFFLYWKFKLHKYHLQQQWEYKKRITDKYGLIILENNTVLNEEGKVIAHGGAIENAAYDLAEIKALPALAEKLLSK
jgi:magnesium-transporting ATPase (P-type)